MQVNTKRQMRFLVYSADAVYPLPWFDPPTVGGVALGIRNRIDFSAYEFEATPGGVVGFLPSVYLEETHDSLPSELAVSQDATELGELGLTMAERPGLPLDLCEDLAARAGLVTTSE